MASQDSTTPQETAIHAPAPRRSKTIGVRLTHPEIAALDKFIAKDGQGWSRAGMVARLAVEALVRAGLLVEAH